MVHRMGHICASASVPQETANLMDEDTSTSAGCGLEDLLSEVSKQLEAEEASNLSPTQVLQFETSSTLPVFSKFPPR